MYNDMYFNEHKQDITKNSSYVSHIHCGKNNMLLLIFKKKHFDMINCNDIFKLGINVDGLSITESSKSPL